MKRTAPPLKLLLAVLAAAAVIVALFAAGATAEQYRSQEQAAAAADPQAGKARPTASKAKASKTQRPPGPGDPVRDGKFEFVVTAVDCSRTSVGIENLERTAEGRYCVVSLSVRNIADEPKYLIGAAQKATDTTGESYRNDELTAVYLNRDTRTFFEKLEPGEKVTGKLVFDIPKKAKLSTLELHDFLLSGGATVTLG
ncbi:hypothetical protein FB565_007629 [Actinoplanes lutulentus]|uniref:DUF4352 domain-containing protein n=1 Tax=Actinoplanes lutulentus TaxID=1287878 RepID=UPI00182EA58C|nr:DUF4352 domain-containing protein [Actinoplanes lutulentus]MBB2947858.1 hypothetical protein [Actinoplanes lutulentus]